VKVKVLKLDGTSAKGDIELSDDVFGVEPRADILHRVVTWQLENRRGTARATRERSDVARTGKKFGRQKGGGSSSAAARLMARVAVTSTRLSTRRSVRSASRWRFRPRRKTASSSWIRLN